MNKFFSKTVKKSTLWAVIMAIVVAAAIVVCAIFGFNQDATLKDSKTLTVTVNKYAYTSQKDLIMQECEGQFGGNDANYVIDGEMSGDNCEIIFVFNDGVNVETMKTNLANHFATITKADSGNALAGSFIGVSSASEVAVQTIAKHFVLRGVIAGVVFAVLAFGYIAIRNMNVMDGVLVGGSVLVSMLLAAALIILCRVPVTASVAAIIAVAGLLTAAITVLTLSKTRNAQEGDVEEKILSSIAVKESACLYIGLAIAVILVGALGGTFGVWFAVASLLGLVASAFVSLIAAPSAQLCLDTVAANKPKEGYNGAKKTSTKVKKVYEKKAPAKEEPVAVVDDEEVVEESEEEVAEEPAAESEEESVEEIAEEPVAEEIAEEPVEETVEQPVEEVAEEPAVQPDEPAEKVEE